MTRLEPKEVILNILHNEQAAERTYSKLLSSLAGDSQGVELVENFLADHERASELLSKLLADQNAPETPPESQIWRDLGFIIETSQDPMRDSMAIKALQTGEERCKMDYEHAADQDLLDSETARLIRAELIPSTQARLEELEKLLVTLRAA